MITTKSGPAGSKLEIFLSTPEGPKTFLTIRERSNGDVMIHKRASRIRTGGMLIDEISSNPDHGLPITNEKISVHRSLKASNPINVIKTTIDTLAGDRNKVNVTATVKAGEVEIIFVQRFGVMPSADGYDRTVSEKDLEVAQWDPAFATYVIGVLVATKDVPFQLPSNGLNSLISSFETEHFRFWIVSSFLMVPAHESMYVSAPVSFERLGIAEVISNSAMQILDFAFRSIQQEYLALIDKLAPEEELMAAIVGIGGYVSTGSDTAEFWENMDRVMAQMGVPINPTA